MAKYNITYLCGHPGRVDIGGKEKDRQRKADWMAERKCQECLDKDKEAERQSENAAAAARAMEQGLPALTGSLKQVSFGETCRQTLLDRITVTINNMKKGIAAGKLDDSKLAMVVTALNDLNTVYNYIIRSKSAAGWWIDANKEVRDTSSLRDFVQRMCLEASRSSSTPPRLEPAKPSGQIIRPESPVTETVVMIRRVSKTIEAHFPEKRDDFKELVKGMGYRWNEGRWARILITLNGSPEDRAAELAHRLLAAGFVISCDEEIGRKAATADYKPEHTSWVTSVVEHHEQYPGWLYILWAPRDDFYKAARRIKGSKYLRPGVVVPPRHFAEVKDFAQMYDFKFTASAAQVIDRARQVQAEELLVHVPAIQDNGAVQADTMPPTLDVPMEVDVDESLRDHD
ncbi:hypothetical protein ACE41H_21390 [Paenibacillus enshidis]|uniref:Uncharacterized protein n=1 Tax=Paenibacillus enshidis TaxID=1458439 RepID=A0ABV5B105_9BACL